MNSRRCEARKLHDAWNGRRTGTLFSHKGPGDGQCLTAYLCGKELVDGVMLLSMDTWKQAPSRADRGTEMCLGRCKNRAIEANASFAHLAVESEANHDRIEQTNCHDRSGQPTR
jgi:hypothetical protein